MRLIDAEELHNALRKQQRWIVKREGFTNEGYSYDQVHFAIDNAPTVDAEPVVRCKDCKYGEPNGQYGCKCYHHQLYEAHEMSPNDFCSYGKRREDDKTD